MRRILAVLVVVACTSLSCATMPLTEAGRASVAAIAGKSGVSESYVSLAVSAAQDLLSKGKDQASAAKGGAEQAATRASIEGSPLTKQQQDALTQGLSDMLMSPTPATQG